MTRNNTIAEIVTFRLVPDSDEADFIAAAASVETALGGAGRMLARTLSRDGEGNWNDHVLWATQADADRAAREIATHPDCAAFLSMIDRQSVSITHAAVARRMERMD